MKGVLKIEKNSNRYFILMILLFLIASIFILQLFNLQIIHGEEYREQSERRLVREAETYAPRGDIFDRYGKVIATSKLGYSVQIYKTKIENEILTSDINVDVLKVAHHGSEYSTNNEFLKRVTPSYAIISVGKNNDYNHPSINTLNRIKNYTNRIYRTDELGTIIITSDGKNINIESIYTDTNG